MSEKSQLFSRIALDLSDPAQVLKVIENRKRRARPELEAHFVKPSKPIHKQLAEIWIEVLRIERIGIHDNFFKLGGNSILATQLLARVRESFSVELAVRSLFESPTIAGLAACIETMLASEHGLALPPIERVERVGHLPLSYAQQRLWFLDQFEPGRAVYNISQCFQLSGTLEVPLLERAFSDVLSRHESLRTTFVNGPEGPVQVISPAATLSIPVEDLQSLSEAERDAEASRIASEQAQTPFDLSVGPLIRVSLVRLSSAEHLLLLTLHHIVCDGWSIAVLMQELVKLYQSYSNGSEAALAELPVQYADYAAWQRQWLQGAMLEQQLDYWKQQLAGAPAVLSLPTDGPRPARQTFKGGRARWRMPPELSEQLQQLSRRHGVTLFMTLLASFQLLLARYSGQEDVVVGTPIANRTRRELEGLIGFFANTLVMRTELSGNPSFAELLGRVREVCLGAYQHQDLPFEKLVEELQPERSLSHSPIFQVMFILQDNQAAAFEQRLPELEFKVRGVETEAAKFDLTLSVAGLSCSLEYNTDLFKAETAERLVRHWSNVLQAVSTDPAQRISEVPLLSAEERRQLLSEWNQTAVEYAREKRVHELIAEQSALWPQAIAVICKDERLTYAELNGRANRLARYLQGLGVGPETVVGICMERSVEMMVGLLAVLKAGAAYLPLDPDYPAKRLEFMIADSQAPVLLTQARLQSSLTAPEQTRVVKIDHDWAEIAAESAAAVSMDGDAGNLAYVIYTSGSTGAPKGVMISHGNVMNFVAGMDAVLGQEERGVWLAVTSISFDISVLELLWTLARGYQVVVHVGDQESSIPELVERHGVTHLQCTPSLATVLAAEGESLRTLSSLDTLLLGGEALPPTLAQQLYASAPAAILNMYGPTETTIWSSTYRLTGALRTIPIGSPIANTELYVLDQHLTPAPLNVAGELYIGGEGVVRGYQQRPELTAARFIPDPFSGRAGARLYRTGDVARFRADGLVEYLGRADQQLKLRGYRIELGEIEAVLGAHEAVQECVVVAQGEADDVRLVAYVVMQSDQALNDGELRHHARERLPQYMVPSVFMVIDKMPLMPNGKVNRRALPAVEASRAELGKEYEAAFVAPRNEIETAVATIWAAVLRVERVGVHDNFFELGGHSLLATRVISRIRAALGVELALRSLFEGPTVAELSESIRIELNKGVALAPPIERQERTGPVTLSYAQQRLWFLDQLEPGTPFYNLHTALQMHGPIDVAVLTRAFAEVVRRHESLRTIFTNVDGLPLQEILAPSEFLFELVDLSESEAPEREARQLSGAQARAPFDLSVGPLLRVKLLRLGSDEHVLLVTMHHIISDGWSMGVLIREVTTLYAAFLKGQPATLAELPVQYADFAVWQRNWLSGAVLDEQLAYWRRQLQDAPPHLELPTDHPRPAVQTFNGASAAVVLPSVLSEAVKELSQREGVTLFMTLLAVFQTLLYRYTGERDIVLGTPIANRNRAEIEELIGFFVNTLVMRTKLSGEESFRELLQRVREVVLDAHGHQDLPFEKLVEALEPERDLSRSPVFQVMFVLQNAPRESLELSGLTLSPLGAQNKTAKFDLTMFVTEGRRGLLVSLEYNTDLFEAARIERMLGHFQVLLDAVVQEPEAKLGRLPLLTRVEQQLLAEWNETASELQGGNVVELFEEQVRRTPEQVAVVSGDARVTYAELNERAEVLAEKLRGRGVGPDVLVGVCFERSVELVVGLLGVLKAGGAYVPLDPAYPRERLRFMVQDAKPAVVVTQRTLMPLMPELGEVLFIDELEREERAFASCVAPLRLCASNLAYVIYTSGSTGQPKGTLISHGGLLNYLSWAIRIYPLAEGTGTPLHSSLSFDLTVTSIYPALLSGRYVEIIPEAEGVLGLSTALARQPNYSLVKLTPAHVQLLATQLAEHEAMNLTHALVIGGENLLAETVKWWREHAPQTRLFNEYGPTETVVGCCVYEVQPETDWSGSIPIGKPIANTRLYILDASGQQVPAGVAAELYIGGAGVGRGYLQRADLTAEGFVPDAYSGEAGARLYRTGDVARYRSDGVLEYLGRIDEQVKVRGYRVEPGEIEAVLSAHEQVSEAVVIAREENGEKRLVAYVVSEAETAELRRYLQQRLPEYMIPSAWMKLEALPLTTNGKVDRRALPTPGATTGVEDEATYVAPRTPTEAGLASIWSEVLKVEKIGIHDNFFALGGHSLLATQVIARLRTVYNVDVPLRRLFESPTVAGLAIAVVQEQASEVAEDEMAQLIAELEYLSDDDALSQVSS